MVVFVILHYKNISDTLECIDSLQKLQIKNHKIIVVENGSLDSSTELLKEMQDKIDVIFNDSNYGFAKGNNIGIRYAKNRYKPSHYIVINNDIIIKQKDIVHEIHEIDQDYGFDVLGPKIISNNNINQNPNKHVLYKTKDIIKHLLRLNVVGMLIKINLYNFFKKLRLNSNTAEYSNVSINEFITDVP